MSVATLPLHVARLRDEYAAKGLKFLAVSAFNLIFGQSLLVLANAGFAWSFVASNVFAVGISAGPAYVRVINPIRVRATDNRTGPMSSTA